MYFEDLATDMSAAVSKPITERDVETFAAVSTDTNPIHLSDEFAAGTKFKRRIAHGLLTASLISAVLGTKLPGPGAIYVSQNLKFTAPVYLGDVVTATVTLVTLDSPASVCALRLRLPRREQDGSLRRRGPLRPESAGGACRSHGSIRRTRSTMCVRLYWLAREYPRPRGPAECQRCRLSKAAVGCKSASEFDSGAIPYLSQ